MARYIEADELQRRICGAKCGCEYEECGCEGDCAFDRFISHAPTADVAPRAEVAREIFAEIESAIGSMEYNANTPRKTVKVEELKEQVDWVLHKVIPETLAELKKKYTKSEAASIPTKKIDEDLWDLPPIGGLHDY